jgi:hypothetical protein
MLIKQWLACRVFAASFAVNFPVGQKKYGPGPSDTEGSGSLANASFGASVGR